MGRRKVAFLSGAGLLMLLAAFLIFRISAQSDQQLTQADLINILIKVLGLEDELPVAATLSDEVKLLNELGCAPLGGWQLERILTKGDTAAILARILGIIVPSGATAEDYVRKLADLGIMTPGGADSAFSIEDLAASVNIAAAMPGAPIIDIPPYRLPVSSTQ